VITHVFYRRSGRPACRTVAAQFAGSDALVEARDIARDPDAFEDIKRRGFRSLPVLRAEDESPAAGARATEQAISLNQIPGSPTGETHNHMIEQEETR
jgi:hypothetical protein